MEKLTVLLKTYGISIGKFFQYLDRFISQLKAKGVDVTPEALGTFVKEVFATGLDKGTYMDFIRKNGYRSFIEHPDSGSLVMHLVDDFLKGGSTPEPEPEPEPENKTDFSDKSKVVIVNNNVNVGEAMMIYMDAVKEDEVTPLVDGEGLRFTVAEGVFLVEETAKHPEKYADIEPNTPGRYATVVTNRDPGEFTGMFYSTEGESVALVPENIVFKLPEITSFDEETSSFEITKGLETTEPGEREITVVVTPMNIDGKGVIDRETTPEIEVGFKDVVDGEWDWVKVPFSKENGFVYSDVRDLQEVTEVTFRLGAQIFPTVQTLPLIHPITSFDDASSFINVVLGQETEVQGARSLALDFIITHSDGSGLIDRETTPAIELGLKPVSGEEWSWYPTTWNAEEGTYEFSEIVELEETTDATFRLGEQVSTKIARFIVVPEIVSFDDEKSMILITQGEGSDAYGKRTVVGSFLLADPTTGSLVSRKPVLPIEYGYMVGDTDEWVWGETTWDDEQHYANFEVEIDMVDTTKLTFRLGEQVFSNPKTFIVKQPTTRFDEDLSKLTIVSGDDKAPGERNVIITIDLVDADTGEKVDRQTKPGLELGMEMGNAEILWTPLEYTPGVGFKYESSLNLPESVDFHYRLGTQTKQEGTISIEKPITEFNQFRSTIEIVKGNEETAPGERVVRAEVTIYVPGEADPITYETTPGLEVGLKEVTESDWTWVPATWDSEKSIYFYEETLDVQNTLEVKFRLGETEGQNSETINIVQPITDFDSHRSELKIHSGNEGHDPGLRDFNIEIIVRKADGSGFIEEETNPPVEIGFMKESTDAWEWKPTVWMPETKTYVYQEEVDVQETTQITFRIGDKVANTKETVKIILSIERFDEEESTMIIEGGINSRDIGERNIYGTIFLIDPTTKTFFERKPSLPVELGYGVVGKDDWTWIEVPYSESRRTFEFRETIEISEETGIRYRMGDQVGKETEMLLIGPEIRSFIDEESNLTISMGDSPEPGFRWIAAEVVLMNTDGTGVGVRQSIPALEIGIQEGDGEIEWVPTRHAYLGKDGAGSYYVAGIEKDLQTSAKFYFRLGDQMKQSGEIIINESTPKDEVSFDDEKSDLSFVKGNESKDPGEKEIEIMYLLEQPGDKGTVVEPTDPAPEGGKRLKGTEEWTWTPLEWSDSGYVFTSTEVVEETTEFTFKLGEQVSTKIIELEIVKSTPEEEGEETPTDPEVEDK